MVHSPFGELKSFLDLSVLLLSPVTWACHNFKIRFIKQWTVELSLGLCYNEKELLGTWKFKSLCKQTFLSLFFLFSVLRQELALSWSLSLAFYS